MTDTEKHLNDEFKGQLYFSHSKTKSYGAPIAFYGNVNVVDKNQFNDDNGRVLSLEVTIDDTEMVSQVDDLPVNVYDANIEQEQLKTLQNLFVMLENLDR